MRKQETINTFEKVFGNASENALGNSSRNATINSSRNFFGNALGNTFLKAVKNATGWECFQEYSGKKLGNAKGILWGMLLGMPLEILQDISHGLRRSN